MRRSDKAIMNLSEALRQVILVKLSFSGTAAQIKQPHHATRAGRRH